MLFDGFHSAGILVDKGGMVNLVLITARVACAIMEMKHGNYVLLLVCQGHDLINICCVQMYLDDKKSS